MYYDRQCGEEMFPHCLFGYECMQCNKFNLQILAFTPLLTLISRKVSCIIDIMCKNAKGMKEEC